MKRLTVISFIISLYLLFPLYICGSVSGSVSINTEKISQGLVQIQYAGDLSKQVKVMVEANGDKNIYSIRNNDPGYVPLQMGKGTYKISVLQQIDGTKFKPLMSQSVEVDNVDIYQMFTSPCFLIDFNSNMKAIQGYSDLSKNQNKNDTINSMYREMVTKYSYDSEKINNLPNDYVPVIDEMYMSKKGICYDYSVMLASLLRYNNIPTKLVMGYAPDIKEYHAWNEIFIDGKWVAVDTTFDSQYEKAKLDYTFAKDASKRKVVKVY